MSGLLPNWLAPLPRAWAQHATWRVLDASGNADALLALHRAVFRAAPPPRPAPPAVLHYVLVLHDAQALQTQGGDITAAAAQLGLEPTQIQYRLQRLHLRLPHPTAH